MSPEDRQFLQKTLELAQENNKILKGIRRSNRWASFMRVVYWAVIIGASIWSYNLLQPYLNTALSAYQNMQSSLNSLNSATSNTPSIDELLNKLKQ